MSALSARLFRSVKAICVVVGLFATNTTVTAQKILQMEKRGSLQTLRMYIGDEVIYKMRADRRFWLRETITELHIEEGYVEFDNRIVHLDSIFAIREAAGAGARPLSLALKGFALSWVFWSGVGFLVYGDDLTVGELAVGPAAYGLGELLRLSFFKTHKLGKRKRLRMIDITF